MDMMNRKVNKMNELKLIADKIDKYFERWDAVDEFGCFPSKEKVTIFDDFVKLVELYQIFLMLFGAISVIPLVFISVLIKNYIVLYFGIILFLFLFFAPILVRFIAFLICLFIRFPNYILESVGITDEY